MPKRKDTSPRRDGDRSSSPDQPTTKKKVLDFDRRGHEFADRKQLEQRKEQLYEQLE